MTYKLEIDGIRAIAVLGVLAYHFEFFSWFASGGFLGVDVFFVISGYLITSIILHDLSKQSFSIFSFYWRRCVRILPALYFVISCAAVVAWFLLLPDALAEFAETAISAASFLSNIVFFLQDSYVAEPSRLKPLLHTWSLSVEFQFYVMFPLLLLLSHRFKSTSLALLLCFLASLLWSIYLSTRLPDANFYLIPSRIWEFLAGSLLAAVEAHKRYRQPPVWLARTMMMVGLLLVLNSFALFDAATPHPSYTTMLPVSGTVLLIGFSRQHDGVSWVLRSWPLVSIGRISYSLYLWHWVILSIARVKEGYIDQTGKLILLLSSLVAAILTYYLVETPFRKPGVKPKRFRYFPYFTFSRKVTASYLLGIFLATLAFSASSRWTEGWASRFSEYNGFFDVTGYDDFSLGEGSCRQLAKERGLGGHCVHDALSPSGTIYVVGDSHASALGAAVWKTLGDRYNIEFLPECVLLLDTYRIRLTDMDVALNSCAEGQVSYLENREPGIVILSMRLALRLVGRFPPGGVEEGALHARYVPTDNLDATSEEGLQSYTRTLERLAERNLVFAVGPIPEQEFVVPNYYRTLLTMSYGADFSEQLAQVTRGLSIEEYDRRSGFIVDTLMTNPIQSVIFIDSRALFCSTGTCETTDGFGLLYLDTNHLSARGAQRIVNEIAAYLDGMGSTGTNGAF